MESQYFLILTAVEETLKNLTRDVPVPTTDPETLEQFLDLGKATLLQRARDIQIRVVPEAPPDTFIVSSGFLAQVAETARKTLIDRLAQTRLVIDDEPQPDDIAAETGRDHPKTPDAGQEATNVPGAYNDPGPPGTIRNPHRYPYDTVPDMPPVDGDVMTIAEDYIKRSPELAIQVAKTWAREQRALRLNTMFFPPGGSEQNPWYRGIMEAFTQARNIEIANVIMHIRSPDGAAPPKDWRIVNENLEDSLAVLQAFTRQRRFLRNVSKAPIRVYISHTDDWTESQQAWLCRILSSLEQVKMIYFPEHLAVPLRPGQTNHPTLALYNKMAVAHVSTLKGLSNIVVEGVPEIFWPRATLLHVGGDGFYHVKWSLDEMDAPTTPGNTRTCQVMARGFCDKTREQEDTLWLHVSQLPEAVRSSITHWSVESHDEFAAQDTDTEHNFLRTLLENIPSVTRYDHMLEYEEYIDTLRPPLREGRCARQEAKRLGEKLRRTLDARRRLLLQTDPFAITSMTSTVNLRHVNDNTCHWCLPYRMEEILQAHFADYPFVRAEEPRQDAEPTSRISVYLPLRRATTWRLSMHPRHGRRLDARLRIATRGAVCYDKRHAEIVKATDPEEWNRWCAERPRPEPDSMRAGPSRHSYSRTQSELMSTRGGMRPRKK
ncbi:hypothetical protein AAVH_39508 [Aphelenchoides avenae]|nr:hypothetical protein AAVH_39508 [Aphelenchus avenae]